MHDNLRFSSVDQRGVARVVDLTGVANASGSNGSDIGAYEAQSAPSADFVDDDIINGLDFLAWQRGFGTTSGAVRTDGNSDDDGDVDGSDLAAWQLTYGQVDTTPLLAAVGSGQAFAASLSAPQVAPTSLTVTGAELIDAAMALQWAEDARDEAEAELPAEPTASEAAFTASAFAEAPTLVASNSSEPASSTDDSSAATEPQEPWLADELLEQVFG